MTDTERELLDRLQESQRQLGIATNALQQFGKSGNWEPHYGYYRWCAQNSEPWKIASQALVQITKPASNKGAEGAW